MEDVTCLPRLCPRCSKALADDAPEGLCAACLLAAATETLTHATLEDALTVTARSGSTVQYADVAHLADGQSWGPYRIGRLLGRGGMGEVHEAEHTESGRRIALKVLRGRLQDADERARFLREGQLAASISHPHTVYIFGSEEIDGVPVISMELLPGGTLKDRVAAEGPLPAATAVSAVLDIIGGLDAAQAVGILHRDIKPSNCFVDSDGSVKVGDFGLSISTLARDVREQLATGFEGTPQFAAPEQLRGEPLDVRADIYAAGATLYYLLTGRPPHDASDLRELVSKVASEKPASPRVLRRDVPRGLAAVVLRCLAKVPAARPQSYGELADLLRPYGSAGEVPAPLGARFIAWIADWAIITLAIWLLMSAAWMAGVTLGFAITPLQLSEWSWPVPVIYYLVLEGGWGASLGKRLMGLRVTPQADDRWWLRVGLRTAVFQVPGTVFGMGVTGGSTAAILLSQLLTILLFSTARRGNGWTGVHEVLSGTRVVQRNVLRPVVSTAPKMSPVDLVSDSTASMRLGPYVVNATVGETGGGRLLVGIDPILRRHVWIHEVPPGTPPVNPTRRDVSRPGRLYWLAGRRSATENWDAFEAPRGEPFLTAPPTFDWRQAHRTLSSL